MSILQILEFPHPNLRKVAAPVVAFDEGLSGLINDMLETMYDANGIGLAATQVDVHKRLIVLDVSEEKDNSKVLVNPSFEIIKQDLSEYDDMLVQLWFTATPASGASPSTCGACMSDFALDNIVVSAKNNVGNDRSGFVYVYNIDDYK